MNELRMLQDDINALHLQIMEMIDDDMTHTTQYAILDARYYEMIEEESRLLKSLGLCFDHGMPKNDCPLCFLGFMIRSEMQQMNTWMYN